MAVDLDKLDEFVNRFVGDLGATIAAGSVIVGDRLVVSTRTVDSHVAAVLAKLGVGTRRAAAARAKDLGLLDPEAR